MSNTTSQMHEGTQAPAKHNGGFPPFDTTTFPSQIFWLAITFAFLFIVMWRVAVPRIGGAIGARKHRITDDLSMAEQHRKDAEAASAAYEAALAEARQRAQKLANENREQINAEITAERHKAEAETAVEMQKAEARIATTRNEARSHVMSAAQDATAAIVAKLTGETVSADDAAKAVRAAAG